MQSTRNSEKIEDKYGYIKDEDLAEVIAEDLLPEKKQEPIRLDKRSFPDLDHTQIISASGEKFALMGSLNEKEQAELYAQTQLNLIGKVVLGQGAWGRVRLAKVASGKYKGQYVAVKKIKNSTEEFARENEFHQRCQEKQLKNVMLARDTILLKDSKGVETYYQIMPLANSGNGYDVIKNMEKLDSDSQHKLFNYLAMSLIKSSAELNQAGIYHRDFKPDNFLLDVKNGEVNVYLSDFGSSVMHDVNHHFIVSKKSAENYWPPENFHFKELKEKGRSFATYQAYYEATDAWRLGLTLLQLLGPEVDQYVRQTLLSSHPPKNDYENTVAHYVAQQDNLKDILRKHSIPLEMQTIILGLLEPYHQQRMTVAQAYNMLNQIPLPEPSTIADIFAKINNKTSATNAPTHDYQSHPQPYYSEPGHPQQSYSEPVSLNTQYAEPALSSQQTQRNYIEHELPLQQPQGYAEHELPLQQPQGYAEHELPLQQPQGYAEHELPLQQPQGYAEHEFSLTNENMSINSAAHQAAEKHNKEMHDAFDRLVAYEESEKTDSLDKRRKDILNSIVNQFEEKPFNEIGSDGKLTQNALIARLDYLEKMIGEAGLNQHHTISIKKFMHEDTKSVFLLKKLHTCCYHVLEDDSTYQPKQHEKIAQYQSNLDHPVENKARAIPFFQKVANKINQTIKKEQVKNAKIKETTDTNRKNHLK